jgi:hypothetical protein
MDNQKRNIFKSQVKATPSWQLLIPSYRLALKNYEPIAFLFFIPILFQILGSYYLGSFLEFNHKSAPVHLSYMTPHDEIGIALMAAWLILSTINFPPAVYFRIQAASGRTPSIKTCYEEGFKVFWKVLIAELMFLIIVAIGVSALVLPGILLFRRYVYLPYYAAQNPNLSFKELFKLSSSQSKPYIFHIYGTFIVVLLINFMADIALGGYLIGEVAIALITYSVLFVPVLRYLEITKYFRDNKAAV